MSRRFQSVSTCPPAERLREHALEAVPEPASHALILSVRTERAWLTAECIALFFAAALLMHFFYGQTGGKLGRELGLPGHDSFYHARMAVLMPEIGLVKQFPWLAFSYFRQQGDDFVSHHYGYHILMLPFVHVANWLTGDYAVGARFANCFFFGAAVVMFNVLLAFGGVRWRWIWWCFFLLMPEQFFTRQAYIRAMAPSLCLMLLLIYFVLSNRPFAAGIAIVAYSHLYLGAVMYTPVIVALYAIACMIGPPGDRRFPWKIVLITTAAWFVGVLTYPYFSGMMEFLRLQVFGTGLTPDIEVGTEWKPYEGVWVFAAGIAGLVFLLLFVAVVMRMRMGPPLDAQETTLLLVQFAFLALTLKSRRFIEYWPILSLLASAFLLRPIFDRFGVWLQRGFRGDQTRWEGAIRFAGIAAGLALVPCAVVGIAMNRSARNLLWNHWEAVLIVGLFVIVPFLRSMIAPRTLTYPIFSRIRAGLTTLMIAMVAFSATAAAASPRLFSIRRSTQCIYDLPAIRGMMDFLKNNSQPGDIIFTADWDDFGVFFYHNSHNRYIVGLDPKFTHERRPDLWERFVRITRGRIPGDSNVKMPDGKGGVREEKIHVSLSDIRDHFHSKWVISDDGHKTLSSILARAPEFAELVYPDRDYAKHRDAPYLVFRIREPGEAAGPPPLSPSPPDRGGMLYLGDLKPQKTAPENLSYSVDRAIDGEPLRVAGRRHLRGISSGTPGELEFEIPAGYERFEATVGFPSREATISGIRISVLLDGHEIFTSEIGENRPADDVGPVRPADGPLRLNIPLEAARRLTLRVSGDGGGKTPIVNWASARFVRTHDP